MVGMSRVLCYSSCGYMQRDYRCMYMAHVCFYVCYSDCVNVCCVAAVVKDSGVLSLGVLKYAVWMCKGCDGCCVF